ncbi:MAG: anion transporter [Acidovorax sp.]|jgi:Na+/H+ antiporter NhaD/arsenite permease-like protein|nr:anion transporter [Acidovorax sp.]
MTTFVLLVFGLVYVGMVLGGLPFLQLDRTGVALLGAIAVVAGGALTVEEAARAVHLPTVLLLFAFMIMSAQMQLGGFYDWVTLRVAGLNVSPPLLLAVLIAAVGLLSAVFSNDVVCLAVAPVLVQACLRRGLNPLPFALALACAANIGSAATLIGNPQNMLIGQSLAMSFVGYAVDAALPVLLGLALTWALVVLGARGHWQLEQRSGVVPQEGMTQPLQPLQRWQTAKGLGVALAVLLAFLFSPWPHEVVALVGAGLLLLSRRLHSSRVLGLVDWQLLVLFVGLFVVNAALERTGEPARWVAAAAAHGVQLEQPSTLFAAVFVLSNLVSNVPAVMLLLPVAQHPMAGTLLALVSTFAGNLFIVGSIANIIVVDAARRQGVVIGWRQHAALGIPVTLCTLAMVAVYLWWRIGG